MQWFFSIGGFVLGLYGAVVGTIDLFVDLEDRDQDKGALKYKEYDKDGK